jgi:hypothetical protein
MAAVSQRIDNYLGGVSKQSDSKKLPGQVTECLNGFPDVTLGLTKRPGFKFISKLKNTGGTAYSGTSLDNAKWFYINRTTEERYIGCIIPKVDSTNGTIHIWNADTGAACTVNGSTLGAHAYLTGTSKFNYDVLTIQDTTVITNNQFTVAAQATPSFTGHTRATILLLGTTLNLVSTTFEIKITIGGTTRTITVTSDSDDSYNDVLAKIKAGILATSNTSDHTVSPSFLTPADWVITQLGTTLQVDYKPGGTYTAFEIEVKGGVNNQALEVFQDWVVNVSHLPKESFHDHVTEIVNTPDTAEDNYFAKFVQNDGSGFGFGYWKETISPKVSPGLTKSSMPHQLQRTAANTFTFGEIAYNDRVVGDDTTNSHPSFVGKKIQKAFFHGTRLGFLCEDKVSMSKAMEPYNFYHASARTITDADPIDINVSSSRPTQLNAVIPTTQGLILFSKNQQFWMYSESGPLTPMATKVRAISNMEMDADVDPIDVGTHMNFISKTPSYTRVFAMQTRGLAESPTVLDIARVVNEWITIDVDTLVSSVQNEFIAMSSQSSDTIYFYKTYSDGETLLMESWFKWQLPGTVQSMVVDEDDMYTITKQGNEYTISVANLSQSPEQAIIVNNQGQKVNPCIDLYTTASNGLTGGSEKKVIYDSANDRTKCYIPYANLTDAKPIIVIAGSTVAGTFAESGFTLTPEIATDGDGTFFIIPRQDLTSVADNVYVGWTYDFDVHLPRLYYQLDQEGKNTDYAATLTIARLKFDVGLSGLMSFKLKSQGILAGSKEYTGDGTTKDFPWTPQDISYVDRNQVKVKINNVVTTAYTFLSDTEIRFTNAPANGDDILIYLDEWYNFNSAITADIDLADDVPLDDSNVYTVPIHQRTENFKLRVFNDSPFPVSLNSMMWEGNYSPRFYRRT